MQVACCRCGTADAEVFSPSGRVRRVCRPCHATYMRGWTARNPEKVSARNKAYKTKDGGRTYRNSQLKMFFGITIEQYEALNRAQDGLCAACGEPETAFSHSAGRPKKLAVDHCHSTGRVRGLLCARCNTALGLLRDDPEVVQKLLQYANR